MLLRALDTPNPQAFGVFGNAVAGTGDLDGDGVPDLLVGAYGEGPGGIPDDRTGRAYALSGATGAVIHELAAPVLSPIGEFGFDVARVPDTDGDGTDDLLVGEADSGSFPDDGDRAHLFSGATGALLRTFEPPAPVPGGNFGAAVAGLPDGDGRGDLLIGG